MHQSEGDAGSADPPKKRKQASDAEKMAVEISKMSLGHEMQRKLLVQKNQVIFTELARPSQTQKCTWRDDKTNPCYCQNAELTFEAYLPDRKYLVRFSAQCTACYDESTKAVHLYCAYCDEVLIGSIAGPGGKISDHLITIRHVYQQAVTLNAILERSPVDEQDFAVVMEYISKLEEWSERIRYPMRTTIKRIHFEEVLSQLHAHLAKSTRPRWVGRVPMTWVYFTRKTVNCPPKPQGPTELISDAIVHAQSDGPTVSCICTSALQTALSRRPRLHPNRPAACPAPPSLQQTTPLTPP
jgi:hypothetical protein